MAVLMFVCGCVQLLLRQLRAYPTFEGWLFCVFCVKKLIIFFNCP
jgi:hypothetical protein